MFFYKGLIGYDFNIASKNENQPRLLNFEKKISEFSLGDNHAALVTEKGELFSWGVDLHSKLGLEVKDEDLDLRRYDERSTKDSGLIKNPTISSYFGPDRIIAKKITCKGKNTFVIDSQGSLWVMGSNDQTASGAGRNRDDISQPLKISFKPGTQIEQVRVGSNFRLALDKSGQIHAWGSNSYGQLGVGVNKGITQPVPVSVGSENEPITKLDCGDLFSIALNTKGEVWTWGQGTHGQLGHGNKSDCFSPKMITSLPTIKDISAGESHSIALTDSGDVFVFGQGKEGQMGQLNDAESSASYRTVPHKINFFSKQNLRVTHIAAGGNHCLAYVNSV